MAKVGGGGVSLAVATFGGDNNRQQIGDGKAMMANNISSGGWEWQASALDGGDGIRWMLTFDGGKGGQLWNWWTIKTTSNGGGGGGI